MVKLIISLNFVLSWKITLSNPHAGDDKKGGFIGKQQEEESRGLRYNYIYDHDIYDVSILRS